MLQGAATLCVSLLQGAEGKEAPNEQVLVGGVGREVLAEWSRLTRWARWRCIPGALLLQVAGESRQSAHLRGHGADVEGVEPRWVAWQLRWRV